MKQFYTYTHSRPDNGSVFYVGKGNGNRASDLNKRGNHHKSIIAKYGAENIGIRIYTCDSEADALAMECNLIKGFRAIGLKLCNYTDGGEGTSGYKYTSEQSERRSMANKHRWANPAISAPIRLSIKLARNTPESKAKTSAAQSGRKRTIEQIANFRATLNTPESKAKRSATQKKIKNTPESKAKRSATSKDMWATPEHRAKISATNASPESKSKRSAAMKKALNTPEAIAKRSTAEHKAKKGAWMKIAWARRKDAALCK